MNFDAVRARECAQHLLTFSGENFTDVRVNASHSPADCLQRIDAFGATKNKLYMILSDNNCGCFASSEHDDGVAAVDADSDSHAQGCQGSDADYPANFVGLYKLTLPECH